MTTILNTSGGTITGFNGTSTYTISNTNQYANSIMNLNSDPASLEVKGKIVHNGRDLEERLNTIEQVLGIPERDIELEKKHPKLKKMYEEYIKELSKYRTWNALTE